MGPSLLGVHVPRRSFVVGVPAALIGAACVGRARADEPGTPSAAVSPSFPSHDPGLVREIVGASHGQAEKVRELLKRAPRLANAAWDWGFGDWETALGAAAHTGRRAIAEMLIDHGARPDVFCLAMLGKLDAVRAMVEASPGLQRIRGPHAITLMQHARAGGDEAAAVVDYLESLGGADDPQADQSLTDAERQRYVGVYAFGPGETDRLEVVINDKNGKLTVRRPAPYAAPRNLLYAGDHVFNPIGAPEVELRFTVEGDRAVRLAVNSPDPMCIATRV